MRSVPAPGPHGGDGAAIAKALGLHEVLDLSASLNPFAPDPAPAVEKAIADGALGRYPTASEEAMATRTMAGVIGVDPARLLLTNGGAEAIALVAAELGSGWVEEPDFSLYRRHLPSLDPQGPRFRSDPNNPTGLLATDSDTAAVWDEAFLPLATGIWSRTARGGPVPREAPAIAVGSVTKVLGCPGLRIGYVILPADDELLHRRLADRRPRWSVSTPALVALPDLLESADVATWSRQIALARHDLTDVLVSHGFAPRRSDAPYLLVDNAGDLRTRLARKGVVVRDCAGFGLPGTVRIAVPDAAGLEWLARSLQQ